MPTLTFELAKKRFQHYSHGNLITRQVMFEATLLEPKLTIKDKGELKGEIKHGHVTIYEGEIPWHEGARDESLGQMHYHEGSVDDNTGSPVSGRFCVYARLPKDSFQTILDANLELSTLSLKLYFAFPEGGMEYLYGFDYEAIWHIKYANPAKAESITVVLVPHEDPSP